MGTAYAKAMLLRGSCHEIVLLDDKSSTIKDARTGQEREVRLDKDVATGFSHCEVLCPPTKIRAGSYEDMADATVIVVTAGINEKTGRAISRDDSRGRLLLLPHNAKVFAQIIPQIAAVAPSVPILVVTDQPDPLADVALKLRA